MTVYLIGRVNTQRDTHTHTEWETEKRIFHPLIHSPVATMVSHSSDRVPKHSGHLALLSQTIKRELDWKWNGWDRSQYPHAGNMVNPLYHNTASRGMESF